MIGMRAEPASRRIYLLLALILSIFAIAPLFYPGYIQTHSGFVLPWNVVDLRANWGDWRWLPHVGLNFDPLRSDGLWPYYLASLLPLQPVTAVKVVLGLGWLLASVGMFLWLKDWLGPHGALVAALVYTYLPHQIATVYVRGAWGEAFFWGLLPWVILATTSLAKNSSTLALPVPAFWVRVRHTGPAGSPHWPYGFAIHHSPFIIRHSPFTHLLLTILLWLILSLNHLGLAIWAFVFITTLLLVIYRGRSLLSILMALLGMGTVLLFYLSLSPRLTPLSPGFTDHFLYPFQLVSAYWGFGPSRPGWHDGLSFQVGLAAVGLTILSLALWPGRPSSEPSEGRTDRRLVFFLSAALISVLLQLGLTAFVWNISVPPGYSLASTLSYPWQLLGLTGLCLAVLAGSALWLDRRLTNLPLFGTVVILVILSSYSYLSPQFVQTEQYVAGPVAQLGEAQLALVDYNFFVLTNGHTAGLEQGEIAIPLAVHGPLQANDLLLLQVTWQPLLPFNRDLKIFVHLVDANNHVLAQYDGQPLSGDYPTSQWIPGELIENVYPLLFPADVPPGPYRLFLGLYDEVTMARLPVPTDPEGRVILNVE